MIRPIYQTRTVDDAQGFVQLRTHIVRDGDDELFSTRVTTKRTLVIAPILVEQMLGAEAHKAAETIGVELAGHHELGATRWWWY